MGFTGLSPEELIEEQRSKPERRPGQIRLLNFYKYLLEEKGKGPASAYDSVKKVRSFYHFYGVPLLFRRGELKRPKKQKKDYRLKLHEIKGKPFGTADR